MGSMKKYANYEQFLEIREMKMALLYSSHWQDSVVSRVHIYYKFGLLGIIFKY